MKILKLSLTILLFGVSTLAQAKLIQIIHTNDLHSFFDGSRSGRGGYSRIKTLVDQLKADAAAKGIKTLFLDAGDFGEGSSYFFSNKGTDSFRALDLLGVDVTVLGNHDYITGAADLSRQIKESKLKAHLLSANLKTKKSLGLRNRIEAFVDFNIDGMKVRIFGLTTPEIHFQYPLLPEAILAPAHKTGVLHSRKAKRDNVDLVIALTHIGLHNDIKLISKTRSINMVIGGHTHTRLDQPKMVKNMNGELIPAFQTGAHGVAVGSVIVDVLGDGQTKLIDYRLYDVTRDIDENTEIKKFVQEAYVNREKYFNRTWSDVIGFSEIPLTGLWEGLVRNGRACWSVHLARLARDTAKTDISVQFDLFHGEEIPAGPIRFGDLIDNFPHFREFGDKGWNLNRANASGIFIKEILKAMHTDAMTVDASVDGIKVRNKEKKLVNFRPEIHDVEDALINGKKIENLKYYSVVIPSEIPFAMARISTPLRKLLLSDSKPVKNSHFWPLLEEYVVRNSPLRCLEED